MSSSSAQATVPLTRASDTMTAFAWYVSRDRGLSSGSGKARRSGGSPRTPVRSFHDVTGGPSGSPCGWLRSRTKCNGSLMFEVGRFSWGLPVLS